ncbi:hypothetical protein F4809DRAFT_637634 [Biscogniauxia mediterranea]|nr:hypothetical protein F4809DRAFT_637634 [Biscogniauxia mediterranea]
MSAETVLITGANGFLALHIIQQALARRWNIVGTVRSEEKAAKVKSLFPDVGSRLSLIYITDLTNVAAFEPAFKEHRITAVINAAAPFVHSPKDLKADIVDPTIKSCLAVMEAAHRYGGSTLKRIVHVGSHISTVNFSLGDAPGKTYSPNDWCMITYDEAINSNEILAYAGAKTLGERAMWDFIVKELPSFDFVVVLPAFIFGPHIEGVDLEHLHQSSHMLWELPAPSDNPSPFKSLHLGHWVDVRDVAKALLLAIVTPTATGERFLAAQRTHWQFVRDAARQINDELRNRIDPGTLGAGEAARDTTYDVDGTKLTIVLGIEYMPLFDSLKDSYEQLLEAEKKQKGGA